jgi:sugar phosphate isomerase/epimerase
MPLINAPDQPTQYAHAARQAGCSAVAWPGPRDPDDPAIEPWVDALAEQDIVIAEVGAWSNPISPDARIADAAIARCIDSLRLAERVGARNCVNIAGSRGQKWDGPHADNFSQATFDRIVQTVQRIIDAVEPTRTAYALEMMPWAPPDSPQSYQALIEAIDRPAFAVHIDPVNIINCPRHYADNARIIEQLFDTLGCHVRSCHAKDIILSEKLTVHLDECCPGEGNLDYATYLRCIERADPQMPLLLEHLKTHQQYEKGAAYIRQIASQIGVEIR